MDEGKGKVEKLSDTLYSRTRYHDPLQTRSPIRPAATPAGESGVSEKWQSPELNELLMHEREAPEIKPFMKKFFAFALFFFAAAIIVSGVVFLGGANFISSKNVDITVLGPTSVAAGEPVELGVTVENMNNTDLVVANFAVQYPAGSRDPEDSSKQLTFSKTELGVIGAGDEATKNVKFILIGTTGETKEIKFSVEYKVRGSNATFYKDKVYEIAIGSAPMTISVENPYMVASGDVFTTKVKLKMTSTEILKNVMLRAEYPYGYSVISAEPAPFAENNIWALGDFSPGAEKTIEIRGRLLGENQDERTFRFYAGVSDNGGSSPDFKSVIVASQETVAIEKPALTLVASFNGDVSETYVAPAGAGVSVSIRYQNNLPEKLLNPKIEVALSGAALDKNSVRAQQGGFYNSLNNSIVWNVVNSEEASELLPGQGGTVAFTLASLPQAFLTVGNREIGITASLSGVPLGASAIKVSDAGVIKIASQVTLNSRALHSIGPFKNSGPIPPKVGQKTTYTILWSIGNTQDDITDAKVTARLGPGIDIASVENAGGDSFSYDEASNTITWTLGDLTAGSGFSTAARETAFQVALTPSLSQLGTVPVLVTGIAFSGTEKTTDKTVTTSNQPLTTRLSYDPAFIQGDDIVQR